VRRGIRALALAIAHAIAAVTLAAPAGAASPAGADAPRGGSFAPTWSLRAVLRSVDVKTAPDVEVLTVEQLFFPLTVAVPIGERFDCVLTTGAGRSTLDFGGEDDLSGAADTKIKGTARFLEDRLLLSAGIGLPTGKTKLSVEETRVARVISQTLLGFHTRNLGEGVDLDVGATVARALGEAGSCAIGVGYLRKGEYTLFDDVEDDYAPGDEFTVSGGIDYAGEQVFLRADATFRAFGEDRLGDEAAFEQGDRVEFDQLLVASWPLSRLTLRAREAIASDNVVADPAFPASTVTTEGPGHVWLEVEVDRAFDVGGDAARGGAERLVIAGTVSYARFGESNVELGDGHLAGFGGSIRYAISSSVSARLSAQKITGEGRIGDASPALDVTGHSVSLGIVVGPGRGGER